MAMSPKRTEMGGCSFQARVEEIGPGIKHNPVLILALNVRTKGQMVQHLWESTS
jgi:hypothetical protein